MMSASKLTPAPAAVHVTVAAVVERDGRFLLVEERAGDKIVFNQPAGHVEPGESLLAAVRRETREETAWHFEPDSLIGIYQWTLPGTGHTYLRHAFAGVISDWQHDQALDDPIVRTLWLSRDELLAQPDKLRSPLVLACIDDYLAGLRHPLAVFRQLPEHGRDA